MPPRPRPQFSHVRLLVKDFHRSWRFYRDSLGLAPRKGHGEPPYGEFDAPDGAIVSIFERDAMTTAIGVPIRGPTRSATGSVAVIFRVPDVDAFARTLAARRVPVLRPPTDRPAWSLRTLHLRDPDGHLVEICSDLPRH